MSPVDILNGRFINTADLHFRLDRPKCRIDEDWMGAQENVLRFILDKARELKCPLIINGDICDRSVSGVELVNWIMSIFQDYPDVVVYALPGNHDLPYHNMENIDRSAYGVLQKSGIFDITSNMFPFGTDTVESVAGNELIFIHRLIMEKDPGFKMGDMLTADELLDLYPDAKYIFTGDNHDGFVHTRGDRSVINPGSPIRQSASQKEYTPRIYVVDILKNTTEKIDVPDPEDMVVIDYLNQAKDRDIRIQEFVDKMKVDSDTDNSGIGYSFQDNLKIHYEKAAKAGIVISQKVKDLISEVAV